MTLDRLRSRGASFAYPDGLAAWEWTGLDMLELAERKHRAKEAEGQTKAPAPAQTKAQRDAAFQVATMQEIRRQQQNG